MKAEAFERMSQRAEQLAARRPGLYRNLLVTLVVAGYLYILAVLMVLVGLCVGLVLLIMNSRRLSAGEVKLLIGLGVLTWVLIRSLWVRVEAPTGVDLRREDVPGLFSLIDEVRLRVQAPPVTRVVLVSDLNAAVVQVPLLGLFGWHRNYLVIGLPLLHALDPAQFRAVLAHEFGHLSGAHGKLGVWIYRVHQTWSMVVAAFGERKSVMRLVFLPVIRGYLPRFSAFSLAQIRRHEYAADQCACDAAGVGPAATALVRLRVLGELEQEAWEPLHRRVNAEKDPPAPMGVLHGALAAFHDPDRAEAWLVRALRQKTEGGDTHPALADRLAAMTGSPVDAGRDAATLTADAFRSGPTAAEVLLADRLPDLTRAVDAMWQKQVAGAWQARHEQVQRYRGTLADMCARAERGELKDGDAWMRAELTEEVDGLQTALPLYQAFLDSHPADTHAMFAVGRALLDRRDAGGVTLMNDVIERAPELRAPASQALARYYYETGDVAASRKWRFNMEDASRDLAEMEAERSNLMTAKRFEPHDLDAALVEALRARLAATGETVQAYLVRRGTRHNPDVPCYVLAVRRVVPWWQREDSAANAHREQRVVETVARDLSPRCDLRIFIVRRSSLLSRIARVKGSRIYPA